MKNLKTPDQLNENITAKITLNNGNIKSILIKFANEFLEDYEKEHVGSPEAMVDEWISNNISK